MAAVRPNYANNNPLAHSQQPPHTQHAQYNQHPSQQQQQPPHQPPHHNSTPHPHSQQPQRPAAAAAFPSSVVQLPTSLDRPLPLQPRQQREVSLSSFAWLYSEVLQYCQQRADSVSDIELKLSSLGYSVGARYLDLSLLRSAPTLHPATLTRPRTILAVLQHIHGGVWRQLFGHAADDLVKPNSGDGEDEYYLFDSAPVTSRFLSVPKDMGSLNPAAFIAGLIQGVCEAAGFGCEVKAHQQAVEGGGGKETTVYIIKFDKEVIKRDAMLAQ